MNKYGTIIEQLREQENLTLEELANILLIKPEKMLAVEQGRENLSESEIILCANVLNASSGALKKGEYRPRVIAKELEENLSKFKDFYKAAAKSEAAILDMLQQFYPTERYKANYIEKPDETALVGFAIYDSVSADYVRDTNGQPLIYPTAYEAFSAVKELEEEEKKENEKNVTEPVTNDKEVDEPTEPEWESYGTRI